MDRTTVWLALSTILCLLGKIEPKSGKADLKEVISDIDDVKEFKKLLRTRTNILVMFSKTAKSMSDILPIFGDAATEMKGRAALVTIDCSSTGKLCKKLKISPETKILKHYKDGKFNKDYDRKYAVKSMANFLEDPTGDAPWEEETGAQDILHVDSDKNFRKMLKKEKKPILMMFYAPWCGVCKTMKPAYAEAATELKGQSVLAGMDATKQGAQFVSSEFNVTGYPTIVYFERGVFKYSYGGGRTKEEIVKWMSDPKPQAESASPQEEPWSESSNDVLHLTTPSFDDALTDHKSLLVMFYAPWCGHCKKMKPEYEEAATALKDAGIEGAVAGVDATQEAELGKRFDVSGYPTVKYFKDGQFAWDFHERTADKIIEFMKDPQEPPPPPPPDRPWNEEAPEVEHLTSSTMGNFLKKKKHALVMYYAPWCGHCKAMKPKFREAAIAMQKQKKHAFGAIDCTAESDQEMCVKEGVQGYPTIKYYNYGKNAIKYEGGRETDAFVKFMNNPNESGGKPPPEPEWEVEGDSVHHLKDETFDAFMDEHPSVLVMFYAPWCGHCKAMKPAFSEVAAELDEEQGVIAAVNCMTERKLAEMYEVQGFPSLKYFRNGEMAFNYEGGRSAADIRTFMNDPQSSSPPSPPTEEEPKWSDTPSNVNHLNDVTFYAVIKSTEHVLVMFHAPWCEACNKAKPGFQSAAEEFPPDGDVAFGALDCTEYKSLCVKYGVLKYPIYKYFHGGAEVEMYEGAREMVDILKYMKSKVATVTTDAKVEL
eukprot:m.138527 g.138527  ORF g.138527 m.138527 type:complete len:765 (+) comp38247_c0_seq18:43-2337(+)